jgi:hypothetical protein
MYIGTTYLLPFTYVMQPGLANKEGMHIREVYRTTDAFAADTSTSTQAARAHAEPY